VWLLSGGCFILSTERLKQLEEAELNGTNFTGMKVALMIRDILFNQGGLKKCVLDHLVLKNR
jgi:hypothetical protein